MMYQCEYCLKEIKGKGPFSRHQAKHVLEDPPKMVASVKKIEGEISRAVFEFSLAPGVRRGSGLDERRKKEEDIKLRSRAWRNAYRT